MQLQSVSLCATVTCLSAPPSQPFAVTKVTALTVVLHLYFVLVRGGLFVSFSPRAVYRSVNDEEEDASGWHGEKTVRVYGQ